MKRKRFFLTAALLLPVLTAIVILLADMIGATPSTVVLADGRVLTVRGISSGTSHRFVYGNLWQRVAALVLPDRWAQKLGAVTYRDTTGRPAHVVWVELGQSVAGISKVWLADEAGTFIPAVGLRTSAAAGNRIHPYMFYTMPTASRHVEVIADIGYVPNDLGSLADRRKLGGSVRFRNPSCLRRPEWRAARVPVVIEKDELSIRLDYFGSSRDEFIPASRGGKNDDKPPSAAATGRAKATGLLQAERASRTEIACRIHDRSNTTNIWSISHVGVINEVGSEWVPGSQEGAATTTNTLLRFTGRLGTNTSWKLRLSLSRPSTPNFDKLSKRSVPYERTVELIAQPTEAP